MALVRTKDKLESGEPGKLWYIAVWGFSVAVFMLLGLLGVRWLLELQ